MTDKRGNLREIRFYGARSRIRLIDALGDSAARWTAPTIFIIAERGIGYADPGLLPNATRAARDAAILPVIARRHMRSLGLGRVLLDAAARGVIIQPARRLGNGGRLRGRRRAGAMKAPSS